MATLVSLWLVGFGDMQEFWIKQITLYLLYFDFFLKYIQVSNITVRWWEI